MEITKFNIRPEKPEDFRVISKIIEAAFLSEKHSSQTEHILVNKLREKDELKISLAAEVDGTAVGHIAFTDVSINDEDVGWYGLGPVAVLPEYQGRGLGSALIREGLKQIQELGARGCVVLGEPAYYRRFGFQACPELILLGVPAEYFQAISFDGPVPEGAAGYHPLFFDLG